MDNLLIILPVFSLMIAGFLLGRTSIFPEGSGAAQSLSTYVWYVAIPALLIKLIANNNLPDSAELVWIATYYSCLYLVYFVSYFLIAPMVGIKDAGRSIFAFTVCFGNLGFIGISIIQTLYGDAGVRSLLLIMSFHSLTLILVSSLLAELNRSDDKNISGLFAEIFIKLVKNPVIVTLVLSLLWAATGIGLSDWVFNMVSFPAASAAPVGLFAVGLTLSRVKIKGVRLVAFTAITIKLIALPLVVYWVFSEVMEFDETAVAVATLAACMPTGVVAYNFAQQYQTRVKSAAATILLGTAFSALTLTIALSLIN
jgi:predicted permease